MPAGRPIEYNESIIERIEDYLATCVDNDETKEVNIPTIDGLAYYLGISRDTIYDWEKKYKEFSYIIEDLRAKQAKELINKGLSSSVLVFSLMLLLLDTLPKIGVGRSLSLVVWSIPSL